MSKKRSTWNHVSKYKKRIYTGSYGLAKGERVFILSCLLKNGKTHNIAFESFQAAKFAGWIRR